MADVKPPVEANARGSTTPGGKAIVLFSDGTGNSSATLFKTNVWRMYEAVDLGPATPGKRPQISFYDNGVGTSGFRPIAALTGILGIGLKRNVLEIYRFACRNYRPGPGQEPGEEAEGRGDHLFGFGFSRGAFTMRLVVALIASQGLVRSSSEAELLLSSRDAYRAFRRDFLPRRLRWPTRLWRGLRDRRAAGRRRRAGLPRYSAADNWRPEIRFTGVWDTVAAYGGPIIEITRAIDNWCFALSMPDYHLNERVRCARHALALDDERDAFQPVVWDELHERELVEAKRVEPDRLQQVWFTGMHADVGGGYPDESLSYVSLLWMIEEAEKAGLRTLNVITDRFRALANSAGPIHDSRSGPGAYYRYQPRRLDALLHPPSREHAIHWDPDRMIDADGPRGLLAGVNVHESVAARIGSGTDRYAPITLPCAFRIVPPQAEGEVAPQHDNQMSEDSAPAGQRISMISPETRLRLTDPALARQREAAMRAVWDMVWKRRVVHFLSLTCTLALVSLPLWRGETWFNAICSDERCVLPDLFRLLKGVLPDFLNPWVEAFARHPVLTLTLLTLLFLLSRGGKRLEAHIRGRTRQAWDATLGRGTWPPPHKPGLARSIRTAAAYQSFFRGLKWYVLPTLVAVMIVLTLATLLGALTTQVWLAFAERGGGFCAADRTSADVTFLTSSTCKDLSVDVSAGRSYVVTLRPTVEWRDGAGERSYRARPDTGVYDRMPAYTWPGVLFRRVVGAPWMKPLVAVRKPVAGGPSDIAPLDFRTDADAGFRAEFTAPRDGRLYLMVNDAVLPFAPTPFYRNNQGAATVAVMPK